jgi:hypothetical protein
MVFCRKKCRTWPPEPAKVWAVLRYVVVVVALAFIVLVVINLRVGPNSALSIEVDQCLEHVQKSKFKDLAASAVISFVEPVDPADSTLGCHCIEYLYVGGGHGVPDQIMGYNPVSNRVECVASVPKPSGDHSSTTTAVVVHVDEGVGPQAVGGGRVFVVIHGSRSGNLWATQVDVRRDRDEHQWDVVRTVKLYDNTPNDTSMAPAQDYIGTPTSISVGELNQNPDGTRTYGIYVARFVDDEQFQAFQFGADTAVATSAEGTEEQGGNEEGGHNTYAAKNMLFVVDDWDAFVERIVDPNITGLDNHLMSPADVHPQHVAEDYGVDGSVEGMWWNTWSAAFVRLDDDTSKPPSLVIASDEGPVIMKRNVNDVTTVGGFSFKDVRYLDAQLSSTSVAYPTDYPYGFWMGLAVGYLDRDEYSPNVAKPSFFFSNIGGRESLSIVSRLFIPDAEFPQNTRRNHMMLRPIGSIGGGRDVDQYMTEFDSMNLNSPLPGPAGFGWGCTFEDVSLDGRMDLLMGTGWKLFAWQRLPMMRTTGVVWLSKVGRRRGDHQSAEELEITDVTEPPRFVQSDQFPNPYFNINPMMLCLRELGRRGPGGAEEVVPPRWHHPQQMVWINEGSVPVVYRVPQSVHHDDDWIGIYLEPTVKNSNTIVQLYTRPSSLPPPRPSSSSPSPPATAPVPAPPARRVQTRQYIMGGTGLGTCMSSVLVFGGLTDRRIESIRVGGDVYDNVDKLSVLSMNRVYTHQQISAMTS